MPDRSQFLGRLAGTTQIVFAALIAGVAAFSFEPGFVPRSVVLFVAFAMPGVVGLIGTAARRPALLLAAGTTSAVGAFIAFSGVTLIFLVPAALFFAAAIRLARPPAPQPSPGSGLIARVALLGVATAFVLLLVGAGAAALLSTDAACWTTYPTPTGNRIEMGSWTTGEVSVPDGATSVSCSTGLISARGAGLGVLLATTALALAFVAARRRDATGSPREDGAVAG